MKHVQGNHLISVIVPVYNVEPYLRRCIDSIIAQKHTNLQIILVDDGSVDGSSAICDEYHRKDDRIEVLHRENGGLVSARKSGLASAKGKYIGFVDGDDYIDAEFYSGMLKDIVENDVDFVHSAVIRENKGECKIFAQYEEGVHHIENKQTDFIADYMLRKDSAFYMYYGVVFKLFKAELIKSCYMHVPDTQALGEDMLATCRCLLKSHKIYMDTTARYHYVIRGDSLCHQQNFEDLVEQAKLYGNLLEVFEENGVKDQMHEIVDIFFKTRFITFFANLSLERNIHLYCFPDVSRIRGRRVVIYCAGKVGQDYYAQLCRYRDIEIVAWADKNCKRYNFDYVEILGMKDIINMETDYLLIATLSNQAAGEIRKELIEIGVDRDKIIWEKPQRIHF